jgi:hypothetical protein
MKNHYLFNVACIAAALLGAPALALADGGTLRASQVIGDNRISVFTSPAVLRVGTIDISVLAQNAKTGAILHEPPMRIRLECIDRTAIPLEQEATFAAATNKLFRAAQFDVPDAGNWQATVDFGEPDQSLSIPLSIEPPLPAWMELAPWIGWPFAVVVLFFVHRTLVARAKRGRGRTIGTSDIIAPRPGLRPGFEPAFGSEV